jgi:hypothetical protein
MQTLLEWLKVLGVILTAILLGELPIVKDVVQVIDQQRVWLLPLTIGLAVVGFVMLLWGWVSGGLLLGQPMTHEEVEQLAARTQILGPGKRFSKARLWGKTSGVQVPDMAWTFQEMKAAWRAGTWWADPDMRRKYIITAGGTLCILGFFAVLVVVVGPTSVKLILGVTLLYALVRLTWAFWQA